MDKLIRIYVLQEQGRQVNLLQIMHFYDVPIKMNKEDLNKFIGNLQQIKAQMKD